MVNYQICIALNDAGSWQNQQFWLHSPKHGAENYMILHCTACWWKLNSLLHVHCLLVEAAFPTVHASAPKSMPNGWFSLEVGCQLKSIHPSYTNR